MPLSNEEQRMLEELEASLVADDPHLAHTLGASKTPRQVHGRRVGLAGAGFIVGLVLLLVGMQTSFIVSVVGFVVMLGCAIFGLGSLRMASQDSPKSAKKTKNKKQSPSSGAFMNKMEDRWRKRQNDDGTA
ncbi:DUF3040 domain-containing protein [Propionibacterium sp.]|uniref:DUF3040 domain-containing protein n=1 Tax=Propionibacterium sp. TaxID=1977903 RepID=UPI0039ED6CDD